MTSIFVILLVLFAIISIGGAIMSPQANVEGLSVAGQVQKDGKEEAKKMEEEERHRSDVGASGTYDWKSSDPSKKVLECLPGQTMCRSSSNCPGDVTHYCMDGGGCDENYCPSPQSSHNLGPGGEERPRRHNLGPGGEERPRRHNLGPGGEERPRPHKHHQGHKQGKKNRHHGKSRVHNNMENSKYHKFIPSNLDEMSITKEMYEEMGKDFIRDESRLKGGSIPYIHDSEAEVLGRMVWRVYVAEMQQKLANSPKAADAVMEREIQLMDKTSKIMKSETGNHKGKKHHSIANQASNIPGSCNPFSVPSRRTTNQFGYRPGNENDIKRKEGYRFEGRPIHGSPHYQGKHGMKPAIAHCANDRACGGVNFNSATGEYTIMPIHARLVKKPHYTALIKNKHRRPKNAKDSSQKRHHHGNGGHHHYRHHNNGGNDEPYNPITGIGYNGNQNCHGKYPRDPNTYPRAYNSIMNLFK